MSSTKINVITLKVTIVPFCSTLVEFSDSSGEYISDIACSELANLLLNVNYFRLQCSTWTENSRKLFFSSIVYSLISIVWHRPIGFVSLHHALCTCDVLYSWCGVKTIFRRSPCINLFRLTHMHRYCWASNPRFHLPRTKLLVRCQISVIYARNSRTITTRPGAGLNHKRRVGTRCGEYCERNSSR